MFLYIITDNDLVGKELLGILNEFYSNKYDILLQESFDDLNIQHCKGVILDINLLPNITNCEFILRFASIPFVFLAEDTNLYKDKVEFSFINKSQLDKDLSAILSKFEMKETDKREFIIYQHGVRYKIVFSDIVYIFHDGNYISFLDKNNKSYKKRGSVSDIISFLPNCFFEVSYHTFVNCDYVFKYDDKLSIITLDNNAVITVSKTKKKEIKGVLNFT